MLVWLRREEQKVAQTRLMAQAAVDPKGDSAPKAFKDYLNAMFPYRETMEESADVQQKKLLEKWTSAGPIQISPIETGTSSAQKATKRQRQRGVALEQKVFKEQPLRSAFTEGKKWLDERKNAFSTRSETARRPVRPQPK
ncbi:MAG: hypothetical protein QGI09_10365 [Dehalococcoidia bacterium]|nr:hypothetical protein [Dehalococcoidia bacterium]